MRGPASAAYLTAKRIGWTFVDGTTVRDERGKLIDFARTAPSCVRAAVERATKRNCAAAAAARWERPAFAHGIWTAPVKTALGRLRPAARAALRRAWTGGYWSRARLADNGLACTAECDRCGAKRDDAYHRIWECTEEVIRTKREAATTPEMRAEAARVHRDDWRFTRGLVPSPWAAHVAPRSDYEEIHIDGDGHILSEPIVINGPVFIDGSALWPGNAEARRAGWSIVTIDDAGNMTGAIFGHLPRSESEEQTSGAAEVYALRRAAESCIGTLHAYSDYKEAVDGVQKGRAITTGPRVKHAAHWRAFWRAVDGTQPTVVKVKGHATESEVMHDADLRWRREGNRHADRMAKRGARAHYAADQWAEAKATDQAQSSHADLCAWIGTALGEWAPEKQVRRRQPDREAMQRRRQQKRNAARMVGGHAVAWGRDGWKCRACGTEARTPSGAKKLMNRPCRGHLATRIPKQSEHGASAHVLWAAEAADAHGQGGADVTWCQVCGAYSSTKLYKLRGRCGGPAQGAALTRLRALRDLRHPVFGYRLHRISDLVLEIMTQQAAERRALYAEVVRASTEDPTVDGTQERAQEDEVVADGMQPELGQGNADEMDADDEMDVFGHGGGLDGCEGEKLRDDTLTTNPAMRLEPLGHSASSDAARIMPFGRIAGNHRGTRVWEWRYLYGKWQWVAAAERCTGRPCFCDLQPSLAEIRSIVAHHGFHAATDAQNFLDKLAVERHAMRQAERDAMAAEDGLSERREKADGAESSSELGLATSARITAGAMALGADADNRWPSEGHAHHCGAAPSTQAAPRRRITGKRSQHSHLQISADEDAPSATWDMEATCAKRARTSASVAGGSRVHSGVLGGDEGRGYKRCLALEGSGAASSSSGAPAVGASVKVLKSVRDEKRKRGVEVASADRNTANLGEERDEAVIYNDRKALLQALRNSARDIGTSPAPGWGKP